RTQLRTRPRLAVAPVGEQLLEAGLDVQRAEGRGRVVAVDDEAGAGLALLADPLEEPILREAGLGRLDDLLPRRAAIQDRDQDARLVDGLDPPLQLRVLGVRIVPVDELEAPVALLRGPGGRAGAASLAGRAGHQPDRMHRLDRETRGILAAGFALLAK